MQVRELQERVRGKPGLTGITLGQWATRGARSAETVQGAGLSGSCGEVQSEHNRGELTCVLAGAEREDAAQPGLGDHGQVLQLQSLKGGEDEADRQARAGADHHRSALGEVAAGTGRAADGERWRAGLPRYFHNSEDERIPELRYTSAPVKATSP